MSWLKKLIDLLRSLIPVITKRQDYKSDRLEVDTPVIVAQNNIKVERLEQKLEVEKIKEPVKLAREKKRTTKKLKRIDKRVGEKDN
jgi:hypothetical protein